MEQVCREKRCDLNGPPKLCLLLNSLDMKISIATGVNTDVYWDPA